MSLQKAQDKTSKSKMSESMIIDVTAHASQEVVPEETEP
jgi:hypothetical protein